MVEQGQRGHFRSQVKGPGGRHAGWTHEGDVGHGVDDHTLVLRRVLRYPTEVGLDDVVSVQEGELSVRLDPDLELCVLSQPVERGHRELELSRL